MKRILILGAGTAGTMMANKLIDKISSDNWEITLIDQDNEHIYQPGLLFLPFGIYTEKDIIRSRKKYIDSRIQLIQAQIDSIHTETNLVKLKNQQSLSYDILIVATGCDIAPEKTEGLKQEGWYKNIFDFYSYPGALALQKYLEGFNQGRLVLNIVEMPIKCPVAPLEFLFLADEYFTQRGVRKNIELIYATPLDGAFTKPMATSMLNGILAEKNIIVEANYNIEKVNPERNSLIGYDGRELDYDLLVTVPLHAGSEPIANCDFSDELGFVEVDKHTLQSTHYSNIFSIGDATNAPASKAGSVAHFQADVLTQNILDYIAGRPLSEKFDGHSNCFIETGNGKAMLIDFNYSTEPLPGKFPLPGIGPFSLLQESEVNHWGKLAFKWVYWNLLLSGKELPMDHRMMMQGKWS